MTIHVRCVGELDANVRRLAERGAAEGFSFTTRLVEEWDAGSNRFARPGELFLVADLEGRAMGFGGLNVDPYQESPSVGRIRHVYVDPTARRHGVGRVLVEEILRRAGPTFVAVRLTTEEAAPFYESLGFDSVQEHRATHTIVLARSGAL